MVNRFVLYSTGMALALCLSPTTSDAQGPVKSAAHTWSTSGTAYNLAVDKSANVALVVSTQDGSTFTATGYFNGGLVGRFTLYGRALPRCQSGHVCLQFSGALLLGGEGGWPAGTQSTYIMTVVLAPSAGTGTGVYDIGPLPSIDYLQYGTLDLTVR